MSMGTARLSHYSSWLLQELIKITRMVGLLDHETESMYKPAHPAAAIGKRYGFLKHLWFKTFQSNFSKWTSDVLLADCGVVVVSRLDSLRVIQNEKAHLIREQPDVPYYAFWFASTIQLIELLQTVISYANDVRKVFVKYLTCWYENQLETLSIFLRVSFCFCQRFYNTTFTKSTRIYIVKKI